MECVRIRCLGLFICAKTILTYCRGLIILFLKSFTRLNFAYCKFREDDFWLNTSDGGLGIFKKVCMQSDLTFTYCQSSILCEMKTEWQRHGKKLERKLFGNEKEWIQFQSLYLMYSPQCKQGLIFSIRIAIARTALLQLEFETLPGQTTLRLHH